MSAPISWNEPGIEERVDALAHGELALRVMLGDLLVAAHALRERVASRQLAELGFPVGHGTRSVVRS